MNEGLQMKTVDQQKLREWLDLDLEGELGGEERARLQEALAHSRELAAERRQLQSLGRLLQAGRVPVRADFQHQVMAALPPAGWERPAAGAWRLPLAMMLILALGASLLLVSVGGESHVIATGGALMDFAQTTLLAGSGLLTASWRGAGMGLEEMFAASDLNLLAMAFFVFFLNLLFVSLLLRRRPKATADAAERTVSATDADR